MQVICKCGAEIKDEDIYIDFYCKEYGGDWSILQVICSSCKKEYNTTCYGELDLEEAKELLINYINEQK